MKPIAFSILFLCCLLIPTVSPLAEWEKGKEWLEVSSEYKDEILEKLKESKDYTEEQLDVINECLEESNVSAVLNCFTNGGLSEAAGLLVDIRDQLGSIRDRVCGTSVLGNKDKCDRFGDSLVRLKEELQNSWQTTVEKGKRYLEENNKLFFLKRKICDKIDQDGCYQWLNERIELKCNPQKIGTESDTIERCQMDVANEVWEKLKKKS